MKILLRIISAPFIFGLYAVIGVHISIKATYCFLRYGGEMLVHMKDDRDSIAKIYRELKKNSNEV